MAELEWFSYEINLDFKRRGIDNQAGIAELRGKYVYIIKTPVSFSIKYEKGSSNICYIGSSGREKSQASRIFGHANGWIFRFLLLNPNCGPFTIYRAEYLRRNNITAYKDVEARLIDEFQVKFGNPPLFNRRREIAKKDLELDLNVRALFTRNRKDGLIPYSDIDSSYEVTE